MLTGVDIRVGQAVDQAAERWSYVRGRPEAALAEALAQSLEGVFRDRGVESAGARTFPFPSWNPAPKGIDLLVADPSGDPWLVFELKVEKIDETLYDVFKLTSQLERPTVEAGYSVVAATTKAWARDGDCVGFFSGAVGEGRRFESYELFQRYEAAWRNLRGWGGPGWRKSVGCPDRVPSVVDTVLVARVPAARESGYELRAIRVHGHGAWLAFEGDWPAGLTPRVPIGPGPSLGV